MKPRSFPRSVLFLVALAPAGCGLANYEHEMQLADAHLQRFDDENRLLGDPLILPGGDAAPAADVFLRPPKGVAKNSIDPKQTPLRYPATGGACMELDLWIGAKDDDKDKLKKRIENSLSQTATWQPVTVQPPNGRTQIVFESAQFAPAYRAYLHATAGGVPVAVVFRIAQPSAAGADEAVKMSLETYADSADASKARGEYNRRQDP